MCSWKDKSNRRTSMGLTSFHLSYKKWHNDIALPSIDEGEKSLLKIPQWRDCRIIFCSQSRVKIIFSTENAVNNIILNISVDVDCSREVKTLAPWKEN